MSYFVGVTTINQLKVEYRRLAAKYHPDRGGDCGQMQEVNAYYEHVLTKLKQRNNTHNDSVKAEYVKPNYSAETLDFNHVKVGDRVYVNGTEGEVIDVSHDSFRVLAKGRARQAIFNKRGGKGKYNKRLNASYDNRHKRQKESQRAKAAA